MMTIYHWTMNRDKLEKDGFRDRQDRHSDGILGAWFTDRLMGIWMGSRDRINIGNRYSVRSNATLVTVDIPEDDILQYEEKNEGSGHRAFRVLADIVNQSKLEFSEVYSDRGVYKINGPKSKK